ncbi:hypothetical protein [Candidatus Sulfurimonas marisnigri]|uniref:hypothetical protein n=1 Tax=Candidatus Sulfurimonas marisnigri TaxID=2740405 RepID=UPI001E2C0626|nr:hypothetical protein [Candidatus Sulfurimonas marisnigri]
MGKPLSQELSVDAHVECYERDITQDNSRFYQCDIMIIAINPKQNYLQTLSKIASLTKPTCRIILMSSTSVYREFDKEVDEATCITKISLQKEAEELMQTLKENVIVLRLGGLMGEDRISGKWKNSLSFSDGFVNYIHKDDVINITKELIEGKITKGVYNLVAPKHPLRSEVHKKNSEELGFELGEFEGNTCRIVNSDKIIEELHYTFLYPDPLYMWSEKV